MGFLDKVRETAQKVSEKAEEAVATGKEKLEEQKLRKRIGELKEQLGGLVYGQRTGTAAPDAEQEVSRLVDEIRHAEEALDHATGPAASSSGDETAAGGTGSESAGSTDA